MKNQHGTTDVTNASGTKYQEHHSKLNNKNTGDRKLLEPMALQATRFVYEPDPDLQLMPCIAGDYEDPARHYAWSHIGGRISSGLLATARDVN